MSFILKQYDTPLLRFNASMDSIDPKVEILWHDGQREKLLPLDLELSPEGVGRWLRHRTIPKNRAYVHALLAKCGLNLNRPMSIIKVCKGLSLNDCYWVVEEGDNGTFAKNNLYENPFSNALAALAFTGYGSSPRASLRSSPEFTTNGMLPKCWRRVEGKVTLYKGGTMGAVNTGYEPYSEFYATQVAAAMDIRAVPYGLSKWKGVLCSTCGLFTSIDIAYLPTGRLVTQGRLPVVMEYYDRLGELYVDALHEMLVFDAIICNVDRHFGNFGFLIDSRSNQIVAPAPLFDHGNSLFNFAGSDCWEREAELDEYAQTLMPCVYDDFIGTAKQVLDAPMKQKLRRLLAFRFKKHTRYNLPEKRLRMIEKQIQNRARMILT